MKLVIDMPEEEYNKIEENECGLFNGCIYQMIRNGIPLPKGHGRLIDAKAYEQSIREHYFDNSTVIRCTEIALDSALTIIEADKSESEKVDV